MRNALMKFERVVLLGLLLLGAAGTAAAQEKTPPPATEAAAVDTQTEPSARSPHRLTLYSVGTAMAYLSDARTIGGVGGGLGVRDTVNDWLVLQADASYLMIIGNTFAVRLAAGVQRKGLYTPAVLLMLSTMFGEQLKFLTPAHPSPVAAPTLALGLEVAPLRFTTGSTQISLLAFGVGAGTDLPGLGWQLHVNLLEVGASF